MSTQPIIMIPLSSDELKELVKTSVKECISEAPPIQANEELITPHEVEEMLRISHQTRIDWTKQGLLQSYSFGGRKKFYKRSEIYDALIKIEN